MNQHPQPTNEIVVLDLNRKVVDRGGLLGPGDLEDGEGSAIYEGEVIAGFQLAGWEPVVLGLDPEGVVGGGRGWSG